MELVHAGRTVSTIYDLKVMTMAVFVLITQVPLAASQRNMTLTAYDTDSGHPFSVWESRLKTEAKCLNFHSQNTYREFFVWPEDQFRYCCSENEGTNSADRSAKQYRLRDFVYHKYSTVFLTGEYHDLVRVDKCLPYWRCWNSEAVNFERDEYVVLFTIMCEYGDLRRLYTHRFWSIAIAKAGILMSALPLIAFLEVGVLLTTLALRLCRLATSPWTEIFSLWWRTIIWVKLRSWLHLILLTSVGNCFMEAIGHQDPNTFETMVFDSFTKVYQILTIIVTISIFTQQVIDWRLVDKCIRKAREQERQEITNKSSSRNSYSSVTLKYPAPEDYVYESSLHADFMDEDYKWQPIFTQVATLALLGLYIRYSTNRMRDSFASLLLAAAAAASTWSALVALIIFGRKLGLLWKSLGPGFPADIRPKEQESGSKHRQLHSNTV